MFDILPFVNHYLNLDLYLKVVHLLYFFYLLNQIINLSKKNQLFIVR